MWELDNRTPYAAERTWVRDKAGDHHWMIAVESWVIDGLGRLVVRGVTYGHAGALEAAARAAQELAEGQAELGLVAGVDSYWNPVTLDALEAEGRLSTDDTRSGFEPGEAAGCIALMEGRHKTARPMPHLGHLLGVGQAHESRTLHKDETVLGEGLASALIAATRSLSLPEEAPTAIYLDLNGERYRSEEWSLAALRAPFLVQDYSRFEAPAACWGDVGAASGVLFMNLAVQALARGHVLGSRVLVGAGSEGGLRATAVIAS